MEKFFYILFDHIGGEIRRGHLNLPIRPMKDEVVIADGDRCRINQIVHETGGVTLELLYD